MLQFIIRRILLAIPTLLGVLVFVFLLVRLLGDPAVMLIPPDTQVTPAQLDQIRASLGIDKPVHVQLWLFITNAFQGDFGVSFLGGQPAMPTVFSRMGATLELAVIALLLAVVVGIPLGVIAALKRGSWLDVGISTFAMLGLSIPNFWLGLMLILLLGVEFRWLPISGRESLAHLIMPAITLATSLVADIARLIRTDVLDVLNQDYIRTARAKGLAPRTVTWKHVLKNALIPTVTIVGLQFGNLLGGSVVVESVFAWPGIGRLMIQSIGNRDFPLIQAAVVLFAFIFVAINLIVDVTYGLLDPRIRYD